MLGSFQLVVDLVRRFRDQKESAEQKNEPSAAESEARHRKERRCEPNNPGDGEQEQDARDKRAHQSQSSRLGLLVLREFGRENRNEDDVVDAEHDLEHRQRQQSDPCLGVGDPIHLPHLPSMVKKPSLGWRRGGTE